MEIRRERADDVPAVQALTAAAFRKGDDEPVEAGLLAELRADAGWLPALSLVAVAEDGLIGHVVCTRGRVGDAPALGLGPISVAPARQGAGVGSALMHAVLAVAEALDERVVCLLGAPAYYSRFGFRPASALGIDAPEPAWGEYFQARALAEHPRGAFRYAAPFERL